MDQGISSSSIKKVDELNRRLEAYKERLKGINKESRPEAFEEMRKSIGDLTSQIEEATEKSDSFSKTVNAIGTVGSIAPTLASFAPKGSGKAITKALGTPLGALGARGAATGAAALGGKGLAVAGGAGAAGIGAAIGARQFASAQVDESLASISDEDFSKEAVVKKYGELLNPLNTLSKIVKDENDGFLKKTGKILLVTSGLDTAAKGFSLLGASLAKVEEALPSEEALGFLSRRKLKSGEIREINTPEEAEAERQRKIKERKKNGPPKFDPKKQAIIDRARKRINPEQFAAEQTKTFGAFTDLNDRPTLSRRDATFNRIGFGGAQSQIAQKIASNQLNTNIKDLSGMEQVEQAKKRQAKDVSLRRQQSSIEFSDSIQVFNQGIKESLGKMDRAGTVTGAGAIQKVEQARQTAIERGFLSDALSEAALTFKKSSDPEALKEAFEQADLRLDAVFKSGSISEQERDKFRTMLENNLSEQSAILNQDVMDRKQLAIDSLKARVQAEEGIVNKLKASFESNLGKLDSNSSQVAADFSQTKTRSERDQFLKNLGISDEGRFQAAIADTTTGQFGQAAVAGAGTELRDYIKEIRASDPEGAEARLQKQFSSGQKQVLSEAVESSNIEGLKKRLFDLQGAKTARGGSFTTAGVTGLINNVSSAGLGDISSVADAERALNVLDAVAKDIGGLSGTKEQTQAQNEIGVQIAALKEKIEAGIGVAKVGIEEQQLATLKQIADNTAKEIAGQKEEGKTPAQKAAQEADKTKTPNMPTPEESRAKMMQKLEQAANDLLEQNKDLASGQRSASEALAMSAEEMAKALASGAISITETFEKLPRPAGPQTQTAPAE